MYKYINTFISEEEPFPADEEEDSPFGNKGGLFSGSKGLFDDSEEDEVRVNYNKKRTQSQYWYNVSNHHYL